MLHVENFSHIFTTIGRGVREYDLPEKLAVKVRKAKMFKATFMNPNNRTEWIRFTLLHRPIKGILWPGHYPMPMGAYIEASWIPFEKLGTSTSGGFVHPVGGFPPRILTNQRGGLALRLVRRRDEIYVANPQMRGSFANARTYGDIDFDPKTPSFDFNTGYDSKLPWNHPQQTPWNIMSTDDYPWRDRLPKSTLTRLSRVRIESDGIMSITW